MGKIDLREYYGVSVDRTSMLCYNCYEHKPEFMVVTYMHMYEKAIANSLNNIANKEIYFSVSDIMTLSDEITSEIVGELVSWACTPTNIMPITIGRNCLKQFPIEWVSSKIKQTVFHFINIADDWDYRRLLELCDLISSDLLKWAITLGENSTNSDIIEAVNDFKERLQ